MALKREEIPLRDGRTVLREDGVPLVILTVAGTAGVADGLAGQAGAAVEYAARAILASAHAYAEKRFASRRDAYRSSSDPRKRFTATPSRLDLSLARREGEACVFLSVAFAEDGRSGERVVAVRRRDGRYISSKWAKCL